jgi:nucleotide-binding universal stress UspA family protein
MPDGRLIRGTEVDGFRLEEEVHRGGMACLWRVTKPGEKRPMLMKVPFLGGGDDPSAIVGFEVEHMILPRLGGPHVPQCIAAGDFAVLPYLVIERIPGKTLEARVKDAPLAPERVASLGAKIATALADLHRRHVIHFDLKPANIMFREEGPAVLLDYGLARHDELPDLLAEESDMPIGTPAYIAPEQVLGIRTDPRSDIFSLGCILYELTTGRLPFGNPQGRAGMRRRLYQDPPPPRAIVPHCPLWLQEVILCCLEVDADARFRTAGLLAHALQHPDQVVLTERAERSRAPGFVTHVRNWWRGNDRKPAVATRVAERLDRAPILMAAVDFSADDGAPILDAVRRQVKSLLAGDPAARLVCVTVLKTSLVRIDETIDKSGQNIYLKRLVALKDWARPLDLGAEALSLHVLEAVDPAEAVLEFVRHNQVDHLVMGARGHSAMRRYLGSVSSQVAAQAPCTVTVVRPRAGTSAEAEEEAGSALAS